MIITIQPTYTKHMQIALYIPKIKLFTLFRIYLLTFYVFFHPYFVLDTQCALCYTHDCVYTKIKRKETKTMTAAVFTKKYKICPVAFSVFCC